MTDFQISNGELKRYTGRAAEVRVPAGVTKIGASAFCGAADFLKRVILPEGVVFIGIGAFRGCRCLKEVVLPRGLESISMRAFYGCKALRLVTFPAGLISILDEAFFGCTALPSAELPEGLILIGASAFSGCSAIGGVSLPQSLAHLKKDAFRGVCPRRLTVKSSLLFSNIACLCEALPDCRAHRIDILRPFPSAKDYLCLAGEKCIIKADGVLLFVRGCSNSFTVPADITELGERVFADCFSLENVTLQTGVSRIGDFAFSGCISLQNVVFPETLHFIGANAFKGCIALSEALLPDSLYGIGDRAFEGCVWLQRVSFPAGLREIGESAFLNCKSLQQASLPEGLEELKNAVFSCCYALTDVSLPGSLKSLGSCALQNCEALKSISFPPGLKSIGGYALRNCKLLKELNVPDGCTLDQGAFFGCKGLLEVRLPDSLRALPDQLFYLCESLPHVDLPQGLTEIGARAFEECAALQSVKMPDVLTAMGRSTFTACASLRRFSLPAGLTELQDQTFSMCVNLTEVELPEGLQRIGSGAFQNCASLLRVTLPQSLTQIEARAFAGCASLQITKLPRGLKEIGHEAFASCRRITEIELPPVEKMPSDAFYCAGVRSFSMPEPSPLGRAAGGCLITAAGDSLWCLPPQADPELCRIPDTVKYIFSNGFGSSPTGCVEIPSGVVGFDSGQIRPLGHPFYFLLHNPAHAKPLKGVDFVYLGNPAELAAVYRALSVTNYCRALPLAPAVLARYAEVYAAYIRKKRDVFFMLAAKNDDAFRFFTEHGLIPSQGVDVLMEAPEIAGNAEKRAVLLYYKTTHFPQAAAGISALTLDNSALDQKIKMQQRRVRLQAQKGVAGVVFVFSGRMNRQVLKARIERCGGIVREAVSGSTDYVVDAGPGPKTEKLRAAESLEIPVISVQALLQMLKESEA